jgi:NADH:ubiquinone oxidoreductase subunit D
LEPGPLFVGDFITRIRIDLVICWEGAISPLLWSFEEREKMMVFFDYVCGCRMHCAYICLLGCLDDLSFSIIEYLHFLVKSNLFLLELLELVCLANRIVYTRLRGIGVLDMYDISYNSVSGVLARAVGILWDCRLFSCYEIYALMYFDYSYAICGDAQDRFILRIFDMKNSLRVITQSLLYCTFSGSILLFEFFTSDITIEMIIYMFYMVWCVSTIGISLVSIEAPKGEYACCLLIFMAFCSRCRIRCADFIHVLLLDVLCKGYLLADLVAVIGNIDCVFGSIDR